MLSLFQKRHFMYLLIIYMINLSDIILKKHDSRFKTKSIENLNQNFFGYLNHHELSNRDNTNLLINFEKFNYEIGSNHYLVPNIVHYICLNKNEIDFGHFLSILSAYLNQKPRNIYIHCNECDFSQSKYWIKLNKIKRLSEIIILKKLFKFNEQIFGIEPGWIHHKSDVLRNVVLMSYGGIYLDNDVLVINSLNKFRKFEFVTSWDSDEDGIGSQIMMANRNARFLRANFDLFRYSYNSTCWYCNGGYYPAKILLNHRFLAHVVKIKFGTHFLNKELYSKIWHDWKNMFTIHLLLNHRSYMDPDSPIKEFDEHNIKNYNFTFGIIARDLINRAGF